MCVNVVKLILGDKHQYYKIVHEVRLSSHYIFKRPFWLRNKIFPSCTSTWCYAIKNLLQAIKPRRCKVCVFVFLWLCILWFNFFLFCIVVFCIFVFEGCVGCEGRGGGGFYLVTPGSGRKWDKKLTAYKY